MMWSRIPQSPRPEEEVPRRRLHPFRWLYRTLTTTLIIVVVLYVTALILSRTPGFRVVLQERAAARWNLKVSIGEVALSPLGVLHLRDVLAEDPELTPAGLRAAHLALALDWGHPWRMLGLRGVVVEDPEIRLIRDEQGNWQPGLVAAPVAELERWLGRVALTQCAPGGDRIRTPREPGGADVAPGAHGIALDWENIPLTVRRAVVTWWDGERCVAEIRDLDVFTAGVEVGSRRFRYVKLSAARVRGFRGEEISPVRCEFIMADRQTFVLDLDAGGGAP